MKNRTAFFAELILQTARAVMTFGKRGTTDMVRFSCEKTLLQQAVNAVSRAVAAKSSIPALEGILLETEHGLRLSGYNMQTGIRTEVEADIREGGRIVLNAAACLTTRWCSTRTRNST